MLRTPRALAVSLAVILGAAAAIGAVAPTAFADNGGGNGDVTWSVLPADATGPDGRSWIELTLKPGEKVTEHLALRNLSNQTVTFAIKAADGYITSTGRFNMLPSSAKSKDAGTWVAGPSSVTVGSGATSIVAFTVAVPKNTTPGDHAAGIAATVNSVGPSGTGTQVTIESRVGFPIMTRVTGKLRPELSVKRVSVDYRMSWNPFQPGQVTAVYKLVNTGNVRMQAAPVLSSQGHSEHVDKKAPPIELLPGESRTITATVPGIWPTFFTPVQVQIKPEVVVPDGKPTAGRAVAQQLDLWAIPIPQLLVLLGIVIVILALVLGRRRTRAKVRAQLAEAREAGRREASAS